MNINIYNHTIRTREHYCQLNDCNPSCVDEPYINLYVKLSGCNARCSFCIDDCIKKKFDMNKLEEVVKEISSKIKIRKISFTGGEPTMDIPLLEKAFICIKKEVKDAFTVINTNGYNLRWIFHSYILKSVDSVALSRHHYLDEINNAVFGIHTKVANENDIINVTCDDKKASKMHLSCNLINGYIDCPNEIKHYLDAANSLGIYDVGFVSLMPLNSFCEDNFIEFPNCEKIKGFYKTKEWKYNDCCECANYLYLPENDFEQPLKVYNRRAKKPTDFANMLMFDGENLRVGFTGEIIA